MKKPDRKVLLAMALSLAAGALVAPARPAHPRDEAALAGKHQSAGVLAVLKKLIGGS